MKIRGTSMSGVVEGHLIRLQEEIENNNFQSGPRNDPFFVPPC